MLSKGIRSRLLGAFAVVVVLSLGAILTAWFSITRTQDKLDDIVSETLPLVHNSLKLDKETRFFALTINEFPEITTEQEHAKLISRLEEHTLKIRSLLQTLESLDFERKKVQYIRKRVELLVDLVEKQNQQFNEFFIIHHRLQQTVDALRKQHRKFIELANPRISESYATFLRKGDEVNREIREVLELVDNRSTDKEIKIVDDKLRVGFETLISSAAGEMRSSLEAVALTYLAGGLLYEAANLTDIESVRHLESSLLKILPKIRKIKLILSYSNPENHQMIVTAIPIFKFGTGDSSIFALRSKELSLRYKASISAQYGLSLAAELTESIDILTATSQELAKQAATSLRLSLYKAQLIQTVAGITAIVFSMLIGWFYVEKSVISRLSALKESMKSHSTGGQAEIPLAGDDEVTDMAIALQSFVDQRGVIENQLHTKVDELNAVMDSIDYGIVFMNAERRILLVNEAFRQMWNIGDDEVSGQPLGDVVDENLEAHFLPGTNRVMNISSDIDNTQVSVDESESNEFVTKDGKTFQYQSIQLPGDTKMLTYFDITELKKNQKKLMDAQRIETIGLMAGGVAHDLNNILSGIVSYPDLLLHKLPEGSELRKPIKDIKESGQRAAAVVADMLTVTRGATVGRKIDNLNILVTDFLHSPEGRQLTTLYSQVDVKVQLHPELLDLSCASVQITKCLMNLVNNAAEATHQSGQITISTRNHFVDEPEATDSLLDDGEYVVLKVTDNGPGISPEDIEHIFEPFYSRKIMGRSGTGLGLTIVYNTVKDHGGTVMVSSDKNGTTFDLYFPASRNTAVEIDQSIPENHIRGDNEYILVVDDELLQREIATQILHALGYRVLTAASGEEAVEMIKKTPFDLVILDMIMSPGINGRSTYEEIIKIRPRQKAAIATGFSTDEEVKKAQNLGVGGVIHKPYTLREFGSAVKYVLAG